MFLTSHFKKRLSFVLEKYKFTFREAKTGLLIFGNISLTKAFFGKHLKGKC